MSDKETKELDNLTAATDDSDSPNMQEKTAGTTDEEPFWSGVPDMPIFPNPDIEYTAMAGKPLVKGEKIATRKDILPFLQEVRDPEIGMSILDLGLLYALDIDDKGNVKAEMGLTAAGCPFADVLLKQTAEAIAFAKGVGEVIVRLVWEPEWHFSMISDEAKLSLDLF